MKLLTKIEYEVLLGSDGPISEEMRLMSRADAEKERLSDSELEICLSLIEQGRMQIHNIVTPFTPLRVYQTSPAGREALKLWPVLIERGLVSP